MDLFETKFFSKISIFKERGEYYTVAALTHTTRLYVLVSYTISEFNFETTLNQIFFLIIWRFWAKALSPPGPAGADTTLNQFVTS